MKKNKIYLVSLIAIGCLTAAGCGIGKFTASGSDSASLGNIDPLLKYAWHIENYGQTVFAQQPAVAGFDLNLAATWTEQIYGNGVMVQISDDGLEDTHPDLSGNFSYTNQSKNYTTAAPYTSNTSGPIMSDDNHGTCVAGLVAAVGWNGIGSRGVAPKAKLTIVNFLSSAVNITNALKLDQTQGTFDISNMSWGTTQDTIYTLSPAYNTQVKSMITSGRNGKGTIFVKSAGNDFAVECNGMTGTYCIGNSNFDTDNALPYIITVGALNAQGESSSYSSTGSNLWISSFGGEFGIDFPAMLTTDRTGCSRGYSNSSETTAFEKGTNSENAGCNYTSTFNGTSSAAPVLSGVIALLLEANPALTWREIKYILAKSATADSYATGSIAHPLGSTLPGGYVWEQRWITNQAGFKFHNWYGFGRVNVDGAIALAKAAKTTPINLGTYTETNWADAHTGLNIAIPDNSAAGATDTINVATSLKIEGVQIRVGITHADISELALELTSPSGTKSIIVNARNSLTGLSDFTEETFLSNAFYQESSVGNWMLKVVDAKTGNTGTLTSFKINFVGAP
jgi:subtilisin-like proprotein convertase family protein